MGQDWIIFLYVHWGNFWATKNYLFPLCIWQICISISLFQQCSRRFSLHCNHLHCTQVPYTFIYKFAPHKLGSGPKVVNRGQGGKHCMTRKWEAKKITNPTIIPIESRNASKFHPLFAFTHTELPHFLGMHQSACGKNDSLCMCVWKRVTEGRVCTHACTTLFSALSHLGDWWWEISNKKENCLMF